MLNIEFEITYQDGTVKKARTAPRDEVALERTYNVAIPALLDRRDDGLLILGQIRSEYLYFLAWSALHRSGQEPRDFDAFVDVISDLDMDGDEEDAVVEQPDPTQPAPQAG